MRTCEHCELCESSEQVHNTHHEVCGKCGRSLSGQTFQGPAGLGMICADCQAEIDREHELGPQTDDVLLKRMKSGIYKICYSDTLKEFTAVDLLMRYFKKLPTKPKGLTTEKIEALLSNHTGELEIERVGGGTWRQVSA